MVGALKALGEAIKNKSMTGVTVNEPTAVPVLEVKVDGSPIQLDLTKVAPCDDIILEMLLVYYVMQLSYVAQMNDTEKTPLAPEVIKQVNDRVKDKVEAFSVMDEGSAAAAP